MKRRRRIDMERASIKKPYMIKSTFCWASGVTTSLIKMASSFLSDSLEKKIPRVDVCTKVLLAF
jgi:hypothetical protein